MNLHQRYIAYIPCLVAHIIIFIARLSSSNSVLSQALSHIEITRLLLFCIVLVDTSGLDWEYFLTLLLHPFDPLHAFEVEQVREHEGNHEVFPVENVRVDQLEVPAV